ncbi:MAG: ABC transporter permease [Verrucomicrobia bacterium]|nr:ABC transporter permease [Verrucomicrobiota bacterium]
MITLFQTIRSHRELVANLVSRELKSRYKSSALGLLWSLLTPLFMAVIYVFFLRLLARGVPLEQIVIGVFAWQFTVNSVNSGMSAITGNSNLVKKVFFPRVLLPVSVTLANLVNFLLSLIVQFVIIGIMLVMKGQFISGWVWAMPLLILYHTMFNLTLALLLSSANVYFRDTQHLVGVFLSAWFFLSPVMYDLGLLHTFAGPDSLIAGIYMLNPLSGIITGYRILTLPGMACPFNGWAAAGFIWPLVLFMISLKVFKHAQKNFADML